MLLTYQLRVCLIGNSKPTKFWKRETLQRRKHSSQLNAKFFRFPIYPGEDVVSSGKIRRRVWCLVMKSKVTDYFGNESKVDSFFEIYLWNRESLQSLQNALPFGAEGPAGLPNLPNLPFLEFGSQSNTNSDSLKSTVFRICTNQTHPYTPFTLTS